MYRAPVALLKARCRSGENLEDESVKLSQVWSILRVTSLWNCFLQPAKMFCNAKLCNTFNRFMHHLCAQFWKTVCSSSSFGLDLSYLDGEIFFSLLHHLRHLYLGRVPEENAYKWHHAVIENLDRKDERLLANRTIRTVMILLLQKRQLMVTSWRQQLTYGHTQPHINFLFNRLCFGFIIAYNSSKKTMTSLTCTPRSLKRLCAAGISLDAYNSF